MSITPQLYHLQIGELIVSPTPAVISTVLGSCVSVCIFSEKLKIGGMIHFALPEAPHDVKRADSFRYGSLAIPHLIEEVSGLTGEGVKGLLAKITGGASGLGGKPSQFQVGAENIELARKILRAYKIPLIGESVGGKLGRKVLFHTATGRLQVASLSKTEVPPQVGLVETRKKKVLIVDDSKAIRGLLTRIIQEDPELEVIGQVQDPLEATAFLKTGQPDVITLDIHMPKMTGIQWLETLPPNFKVPVVMISSLQMQDGNEVFRALELGAVDYIEKPGLSELSIVGPQIRDKIKAAVASKVVRIQARGPRQTRQLDPADLRTVVCIGASTGGTEALKNIICSFPLVIPPTLIVQHIPSAFSTAFANRLNELCPFEVKEAQDRDELKPSRVLIAPGGMQMKVEKTGSVFRVRITDDPHVNRHKPSIDYLFHSVATVIGKPSLGVILTGMGSDGAQGLLAMRNNGSITFAQDESTSVVYGMPKVAAELGAVQKVLPLGDIAREIFLALGRKKTK